jgi:hypothetical protein
MFAARRLVFKALTGRLLGSTEVQSTSTSIERPAKAWVYLPMAQNSPPKRVVGLTALIVMFLGFVLGGLLILGIWTDFKREVYWKSVATVFILFFLSIVTHSVVKGYYGLPPDRL